MKNVLFDNVKLMYILIPLAILLIVPFVLAVIRKKNKIYDLLSLFLRMIICFLLVLTLSGIKRQEINQDTIIYILADTSSSDDNVLEQMDDYINEFNEKMSLSSKLGIVTFAANSKQLVAPGEDIISIKNAAVDKSATNYQQALLYTANLFEKEYKKRIVLLSDGKQTEGDAMQTIKLLNEQNIRVDAVFFNSDLTSENKEVQISSVEYNKETFKGNDVDILINLQSSFINTTKLIVKDNNKVIYDQNVDLFVGNNEIKLKANTSKEGLHNYEVYIENSEDECLENNVYYFLQNIHEKCEILIISSTYKDATNIKNLITENANCDILISYDRFSTNIDSYIKYDEIILSNFDIKSIDNYDKIIDIFETLVSKYGKSLLTFGGENTYYDGNFYTSKMKDLLPVDINPNDTKKRTAIILLIDTSGSMEGSKLEMAKKGAIQCLDVLNENDYVGVITFSDNTYPVQPLRLMNNKDLIIKKINRVVAEDGTMMTPGLELAYSQMMAVDSQMGNKEIILISDGMPSDSGQLEVASKMAENGIKLSTINIGNATNNLLNALATTCNGNYYVIKNADNLPDIMLQEVSELSLKSTINESSKINIVKSDDAILNGISSLINVNGYNFSSAKSNATTVLTTSFKTEDGILFDNVPLLSYWHFGLGVVSSFMSDVSNWGENLFASENGKKLFNQIIKSNYPKEIIRNFLTANISTLGYTSKVEVYVPKIYPNVRVVATLTSPSGNNQELDMVISNGKYVQTFETKEIGTYQLRIKYLDQNTLNVYFLDKMFSFSYSCEYDRFSKADNILLWQIVNDNGVVSNDIDEIVNIKQDDVVTDYYFDKQLLIAVLVLFILDVALRKIKFSDLKRIFNRKKAENI